MNTPTTETHFGRIERKSMLLGLCYTCAEGTTNGKTENEKAREGTA